MNFTTPLSGEYLFIIKKNFFRKLKIAMYFWIDKNFFTFYFVERALLVHKTLNFNHQNISCSYSSLLPVVSLVGQCCLLAPPGERAGAAAVPPPLRHR